jgi:hypothetical protein
MVVQLRASDELSKSLVDLPEEYYTETTYALGVIQAESRGNPPMTCMTATTDS